mgnify:CR=1 FL=1
MTRLFAIFLLFISVSVFGQSRLKQGQLYNEGDSIYAPVYGIKSIVPKGWVGMLPQGSEIFLLSGKKGNAAQIYIFADTASFDQLKKGWLQGLEIREGRYLKSDGNIIEDGDRMHSGVLLTGGYNTSNSGYIEARCGAYGRCLQILLICPTNELEEMKKVLDSFIKSVTFVPPIMSDMNVGFDWNLFLASKHLISIDNVVGTKSVNELWLCPDGSFKSNLKRTGLVKEQLGKYKGKKKGTWKTNSVGATGVLILEFEKLPAVEVDLKIEDDKTFFNGRRHMVLNATNCN